MPLPWILNLEQGLVTVCDALSDSQTLDRENVLRFGAGKVLKYAAKFGEFLLEEPRVFILPKIGDGLVPLKLRTAFSDSWLELVLFEGREELILATFERALFDCVANLISCSFVVNFFPTRIEFVKDLEFFIDLDGQQSQDVSTLGHDRIIHGFEQLLLRCIARLVCHFAYHSCVSCLCVRFRYLLSEIKNNYYFRT